MKTSLVSFILAAVPALAAPNGIARSADPTGPEFIEGRYIIQLKPGTSPEAVTTHHNAVRSFLRRRDGSAGSVHKTFQIGDNFNAYSGSFDNATLDAIKGLDEVLTVEQNQVIRFDLPQDDTLTALPEPSSGEQRGNLKTQRYSQWSLGDLSHREAGSNEYVYDETAGEGMTAYVLDTGIRLSHPEFGGRASFGYNALTGLATPPDDNPEDGHGTHIAGIIAGKRFGVAKKAKVIDVKIMQNNESTTETILDAITWAVDDIKSKGTRKKSVLNMSFAGRGIYAHNRAVLAAYNEGVLSVVASGNDDRPAKYVTPASQPEAFTVGMTQWDRARVQILEDIVGSCYGPELDVFAPGRDIISASHRSDRLFATKSGSSMATALVSGLVCYLRGLEGGFGTPDEVTARIIELAIPDVVADARDSPNLLVNNGSGR